MVPPTLDTLPTELQGLIADSIDGHLRNASLRSIALTARCFREVARETLMCAPCFQINRIHAFMWELLHHSRFVHKISRLELASTHEGRKPRFDLRSRGFRMTYCGIVGVILEDMQALKEKCEEIINFFADNDVHRLAWTQALNTDIVSALVGILILGLPNLRELYLGPSWLMDYPFFSQIPSQEIRSRYPSWWNHLYLAPVLKQLQSRLTILEFPANFEGFYFIGMPRAIFDFRGFQHLTELNISMKALFWTSFAPWRSPTDPSTILPRALEVLRVSECTATTANFANQLCLLIKRGQFSALRRVELYFKHWRQKIEMDAEEFRCMHPVKDTRQIFSDAGLELYLYFPGVEWNTREFGSTPWSCKAEGLLQETEIIALNLHGSPFNTFEMEADREGDVEMGGSKY